MSSRTLIYSITFLFLSISYASTLLGQTSFFWLPKLGEIGGQCYEIDTLTGGDRYRVTVPSVKCKPNDTTFYWLASPSSFDGRCFEVSKKTHAEYAESVMPKNCFKSERGFKFVEFNKKFVCLKVLEGFDGEEIYLKTKESDCKPNEGKYIFELKPDKLSGQCFFVSGNYKVAESLKFCRPEKLSYYWLEEKNTCFELHPEGPEYYIQRAKAELCSKKEDDKKFIADLNSMKFTCLQVFINTEGKTATRPLPTSKCRTKDIAKKFYKISPLKGFCLEEDSKEGAMKYANMIALSHCRPDKSNQDKRWFDQKLNLEDHGCYLVDKETQGDKYIEKIKEGECGRIRSDLLWEPSEDGWSGRCVRKGSVAEKSFDVIFKVRECLPEKIEYLWKNTGILRGDCYKVDALNGRFFYSEKVPSHFCRPSLLSQMKYFFYIDPKGLGACYLVDVKTNGENYSEKVENSKCKLNL